ncbi:MAG: EF-hand domain-containing protein [Phycisphaera sp.]|nr:MAG: EF-hand domain-containing protein [Phycisphaera sp.]
MTPTYRFAPAIACLFAPALAAAQSYDLVLTDASGLDGTIAVGVETDGSLIGDWDPDTNPDGTRTKPGLFGSFGPTENVPVPATAGLSIGDDLSAVSGGAFSLSLDPDADAMSIAGAMIDLLGGSPLSLPAEISLQFDTFRTRAPDSTFIGGFPLTFPLGELALTELVFAQTDLADGVLMATAPGEFTFMIAIPGTLTGEVDAMGAPVALPPTPFALPLTGTITVDAGAATLISAAMLDQETLQEPMTELPGIPLPLPTILPPGSTANVVLNLTLESIALDVMADLTLVAEGPESGCPADCDGDGSLSLFDFLCFQNLFAAGDPLADCDGDGSLSLFDFLCFQNAFAAGCE